MGHQPTREAQEEHQRCLQEALTVVIAKMALLTNMFVEHDIK